MGVRQWKFGCLLILGCIICQGLRTAASSVQGSGCDNDAFQCHTDITPGERCVPKQWVCDGERDCNDGEDEEPNCPPPTCTSKQFQCKGMSVCIPEGWVCDQEPDCNDGSDEDPKICPPVKKNKGIRIRGESVNKFRCMPNHYQCPGTQKCIPIENICNGVPDCDKDIADEGAICVPTSTSSNISCDNSNCAHGCKESLQGPLCFCPTGYAPNGTICVDLDECLYEGYCDQLCQNSKGGFNCSCVDGYSLTGTSKCKANTHFKSTVFFTNTFNIRQVYLDGSELSPSFSISGKDISAMDFNIKNKTVCWISKTEALHSDWRNHQLTCARIDDPSVTWTIHTQLSVDGVDQMAFDWSTGNWYFTDYESSRVFVCTSLGKHCLSIIQTNITKPRGVTLDPLKGYLFYSDWGNDPKIERASLDGSNRLPIITQKIIHPRGLAVDLTNQHLYWSDAYLDYVERSDYNGENRKVIFHGEQAEHIFGISVFENYMYLSNQHGHEILRVHRLADPESPPKVLVQNLTRPTAVHLYQEQRQPKVPGNPCKDNGGCEQLCFPLRDKDEVKKRCACQPGYLLVNDSICQASKALKILLYANGRKGIIHGISLDASVSGELITPIEGLDRPTGLAFDPQEKVIFYSEIGKYQISKYNMETGASEVILSAGVLSCEGLAVDWISRNLYWTDSVKKTVNVARLDDFSVRKALIQEEISHPKAIVLDYGQSHMYFTDWNSTPADNVANIQRANLDGTNQTIFINERVKWPSSLYFDATDKILYWTDTYHQRIQSVNVSSPQTIITVLPSKSVGLPFGVVVIEGEVYWTELTEGKIKAWNQVTKETVILRNDSAPMSMILLELTMPPGAHGVCAVNNGGCMDLCLPTMDNAKTCTCSQGRRITTDDNNNCEDIPDYTPMPICDLATKFKCTDGSCINKKYKCDGKPDCQDGSDEDKKITCADHECREDEFQCDSNLCISTSWRCDGTPDCPDGEDESNCIGPNEKCPPDHHKCNNGRCIPEQWWCDHEEDCSDGGDEKECKQKYTSCNPDQFKCDDNQCIPYSYRCDRDKDCQDNSDEFYCQYQCDVLRDFQCKNTSTCFPMSYKCDGDKNCEDGSDEYGCPVVSGGCHENEFSCFNGDCFPKRWKCDRDYDCSDRSDELNCTGRESPQCAANEFQCKSSGRCLLAIWKCDKEDDCEDGSDEDGCTYQAACSYPKRTCKNNTMVCLSPEKLCDGRPDCEDGSDEGGLCAYDLCANHDCSGKCSRAPDGFICTCPDNMKLKSDNKTCIDIDICETWGICSQKCETKADGYKCTCFEGFEIQDGYSCKPNSTADEVYVIFSNRHEIRRVEPNTKQSISLVSGLRNTIAIDYCYKHNWIFWTDVVDDKIWRGTISDNSVTNIQPIIDVGLATTEGLAIDWVGEKIYWVESNLDQIEVARLNGTDRTTLVAGGMVSPRAIVLDPRVGALFWTDWDGKDPRIEGCSMSGNERRVVFNISSIPSGGWPNGLAIDYDFMRLYWIDARSDSVHTTTYEGTDHRLILKGHPYMSHPFAISMFGEYIYWTDWKTNSLIRANKFNGSESEVIQKTISQPFDLQVYSSLRQPQIANPCDSDPPNGGCSHLCLLNYNGKVGCRCPHLKKLSEDGKTCKDDNRFLLFAKLSEIRGVDLEDAHFNVIPSITVPYVDRPSAVDYDVQQQRIYWTDLGLDSINSAFLNGTGFETIIDTGIPSPTGFAVDWMSRNMYFTSNGTKGITISVANLNGAYRSILVSDNITSPNSLAVNPEMGYLFWSDDGGVDHQIVRSKMDGSDAKVIAGGGKVKGPASLTIDMKTNKLYWINTENNVISHCDFNGDNHEELAVPSEVKDPVTITVYHQSLYVAGNELIGELNGDVFKQLRDSTPGVRAMTVYDPSGRSSGTNGCSKSNGGCAQLCLPVGAILRVCKCTAGYQLTVDSQNCVGIKSFLMYSTGTKIQGMSLDPTDTVLEGLPPISKINLASAIDFYGEKDYVYWVDSNSRKISRIKRDLTQRETIIKDGLSGVDGLAVDWVAGNLYWTDHGHHTIEVARLNGSSRYVLLHGNMDKPRSIVLFPAIGYMFWADWGLGKIERSYLDGTNRKVVIETKIQAPTGLTIDYDTKMLYWCDQRLNILEKCDMEGFSRKVIVTNLTDCQSLTVFQDYIYWIDSTELGGSIKRANKHDGSQITVMRQNLGPNVKDLQVYDLRRQRETNRCSGGPNGWCQELCLYRGDGERTCACAYGKLDKDEKTCKGYEEFLLYSEVVTVKSIPLTEQFNPNSPLPKIESGDHMKNVIGLAYDFNKKLLFYSDIQRGDIQQVNFDGSGFKVIMENEGSAEGLAYDEHTQYLYWSSYSQSSIVRLSLDPNHINATKEQVLKFQSADHPRAIVINSCGDSLGQIFWTNWNDRSPCIQRAYMDGSDIRNIITTEIRTPNGLTIDHAGQALYWSDAFLDKIERCDFNGGNRMVILTSIPQHSFGLAVHGNFIYWTDWVLRAVLRANKYDGSGVMRLRKDIRRQPMSIIAVGKHINDCHANPCFNNIMGCTHNCTIDVKGVPSCFCPDTHKLLADNRTCSLLDQTTCSKDSFVCGNGLCIPYQLTCNDISDCPDGTDESEQYCASRECPSDKYFMCSNRRCIQATKVCDKIDNCGDNSDESSCTGDERFQCNNGMYIKKIYRCDRDNDCADNSDEIGCNLTCANLTVNGATLEGFVSCNTTSACILPSWICDQNDDCWDNNDEVNCDYTAKSTCTDGSFHCTNNNCIPQGWHCDKEDDCGDNSDEDGCSYTCKPGLLWQCKRDQTCIPNSWRCDGNSDCLDESDEQDCDNTTCNTATEIKCHSGRCISQHWLCDGDADCPDGEDESPEKHGCYQPLKSSGRCLLAIWKCDKEDDCEDGSDEDGCTPNICDSDEFMCKNRRCIRASFYCDHELDCEDGSDEPDSCRNNTCLSTQFQCQNLECISNSLRCDGLPNCRDHTDEMHCSTVAPLACGLTNTTEFQCGNGLCINDSLVCNGRNDCGDYSDESEKCGLNECKNMDKSKIPACNQICEDLKIGYKCSCYSGYVFNETAQRCVDVDECQGNPCDHYCHNTIGRFFCSCAVGYDTEPDTRSCKAWNSTGPAPHIIVSNKYYIRLMNLTGSTVSLISDELKNAVAVDFDWSKTGSSVSYVYWSDITTSMSKICRMKVNNLQKSSIRPNSSAAGEIEILHDSTVRNPDGIAVDWVAGNLYWCDKMTDTIEVSRLDGRYRKVLVREGLQEPRALEVFPQKGLLFYTDWGKEAHISRMNLDGTNPMRIVTDDLTWPNALTIDYITEKLFWADARLDYITMANLDGSNKKAIISQKLIHVFAMTTFGSYIYWTDWETKTINRARKFTGENITEVAKLIHRPMDIQIYHPLRRIPMPDSANPCFNNGGCGNLCLLRPGENGKLEKTCACPENHYLANDNSTCIANCTSSQILCDKTYKCIPFWWKCDGHVDCEDGSDEPSTCGAYHCSQPGLYQCDNATSDVDCLPPTQICDGKPQCASKSDESNCEKYHCLHSQFKCTSEPYKCIAASLRCDGNKDCTDGEDEEDCAKVTCAANQFQCDNGRCVPYIWRCDLDDDCGDQSDEPDNCTALKCNDEYLKCNRTGRCIPKSWQCDGDNDCGSDDITDEDPAVCSNVTCQPSYFQCDNNRCIPGRWTCDYDDDCRDGSDESANCTARNCSESEMRCGNDKCIQSTLWCDGVANCDDGSDEANCSSTVCLDTQFKCKKVAHCIPQNWLCDGDTDCADGSDEVECGMSVCSPGEFRCENTGCRPMAWRCDGDDDCGDGSDEEDVMCANSTCPPGRFRCDNHKCIWAARVCDGEDSCDDGSDEANCDKNSQVECEDSDFKCSNGTQCVSYIRVCDGVKDCDDRADELPTACKLQDETCAKHTCQFNCTQLTNGIRCECPKGLKLAPDARSCIDVNECEKFGTCSQICENFPATYRCHCEEGYQRSMKAEYANQCVATGKAAFILIADEDQLKKVNVFKQSPRLNLLNEEKYHKIDSVSVDIKAMKVFVLSHESRYIHSFKLEDFGKDSQNDRPKRKAGQSPLSLQLKGLQDPRGLAVDWVNQHIYWTDAGARTISLADYEGQRQITLVSTQLGELMGIAVDPHAGRIFWTDHGFFAKIESANLDGSDRKVLVHKNILWPLGLAIDYPAQRLYWTDAKAYSVESIRLDGSGRQLVSQFTASDPPYMIDVFEDKMYVSTSKHHKILQMDKFGKGKNETLLHMVHIGAVLILQENRQKQLSSVKNNCTQNKCGFGLCVNMPTSKGYSCLCPDGAEWQNMTKRCEFRVPGSTECENNYCQIGGTCHVEDKKPVCKCAPGYVGDRCEKYVCTHYCLNFGFCFTDASGNPHCSCIQPYSGDRCQKNLCLHFQCYNNGTCATKRNNMQYCKCPRGFKGPRCESCNLPCYNGGSCRMDETAGKMYCVCHSGYDPVYNCKRSACDNHACQNDGKCVIKNGSPACKCRPPYSGSLCEISPCRNHCLNNGSCTNCLVLKEKLPICTACSCPIDFEGKHCEHRRKGASRSQTAASNGAISIVIPLAILLVILLVLLGVFLYRKRKSLNPQFKHRRIQDTSNVEINNPIYLSGDYDEDPELEADERQPLGDTYQFEQDKSTNFANPMYDTLYQETAQGLVPANKAERNQLLDDGLKVRYYSNGSKRSGNKNSYA